MRVRTRKHEFHIMVRRQKEDLRQHKVMAEIWGNSLIPTDCDCEKGPGLFHKRRVGGKCRHGRCCALVRQEKRDQKRRLRHSARQQIAQELEAA